jgi:hypothetical protein
VKLLCLLFSIRFAVSDQVLVFDMRNCVGLLWTLEETKFPTANNVDAKVKLFYCLRIKNVAHLIAIPSNQKCFIPHPRFSPGTRQGSEVGTLPYKPLKQCHISYPAIGLLLPARATSDDIVHRDERIKLWLVPASHVLYYYRLCCSFCLVIMATDAKTRSIDRWRHDVANSAQPMVVPSSDRAFRRGAAEPAQVLVDDGYEVRTVRAPSSIGRSVRRSQPRPTVRLARRASSYDGDRYSRRNSVARSPTRTIVVPTTSGKRSSLKQRTIVQELPSTTSTATTNQPRSTIWTSILPSSRSGRSRTVTYDKPRAYSRSPPRRRYVSTRTSEPDYVERAPRPRRAVSRVVEKRRGSLDMEERMRLLAIRDKFREEVDRARRWQDGPIRYRDYDRRLVR